MGQVRLLHLLSLWALESPVVIGKITLYRREVEGGEYRARWFPLQEEIEAPHDEAFDILALISIRPAVDIGARDLDHVSSTLAGVVDAHLTHPAVALLFRAHDNHLAQA
jgi:hypothetical protein